MQNQSKKRLFLSPEIQFLSNEGELSSENRIYRQMDLHRNNFYADFHQASMNCTDKDHSDLEEDEYALQRQDERMSFENVENKISICEEGFQNIIYKVQFL